jgi:hypothetical protein
MTTFQITLNAAQLAKLAQKIKALAGYTDAMLQQGVLPEQQGVRLSYVVSRNAQGGAAVTFTVLKRPPIPVAFIQSGVEKMIDEA